jgi:ankyrin repeat protein
VVAKPGIDLKANFLAYMKQNDVSEAEVKESVLKAGYWNPSSYSQVKIWLDEELPKLKAAHQFDADQEQWIVDLQARIKETEDKPDLSQAHINAKLAAFHKKYSPDDKRKIQKFEARGHCHGHGVAEALSVNETHQLGGKFVALEDREQFVVEELDHVYQTLSTWDEVSRVKPKVVSDISKFSMTLFQAQHCRSELGVYQNDVYLRYGFKEAFKVVVPFTLECLELVVKEVLLSGKLLIGNKNSVEFVRLSANTHVTRIDKFTDSTGEKKFTFAESNNLNGRVPDLKTDADLLTALVFAGHQFKKTTNYLEVEIYSKQPVYQYISTSELLKKVDLSQLGKSHRTSLLIGAIEANCVESFDFWASKGVDLDFISQRSYTLLHGAASRGRAEMVRKLYALGFKDVNAVTATSKRAALHFAARFGFAKTVEALLEHKDIQVNPQKAADDKREFPGWTPCAFAVRYGHLETVRLFLKAQVEVNASATADDKALLHLAVEHNHPKIVDLLLESKADVFALTIKGKFAFELTVGEVRKKLLSEMLARPESENISNSIKQLFFLAAASAGEVEAVRVLLAQGVDANLLDSENRSALSRAVAGGHIVTTRILLEAKANPNVGSGDNPLLEVIHPQQNIELLNLLLQYGADPEAKGIIVTPLKRANNLYEVQPDEMHRKIRDILVCATIVKRFKENNHRAALDLLTHYQPDINTRLPLRHTLLTWAAEAGDLMAMALILAHRPEVNAKGPGWNTALHIAARAGNLPMVQLLMRNNANPLQLTEDWDNAMDVAANDAVRKELALPVMRTRIERYRSISMGEERSFWKSKKPRRLTAATALLKVIDEEEDQKSLDKFKKKFEKNKELTELGRMHEECRRYGLLGR